MSIDRQIKKVCVSNDISLSELARRLNKSPQALSQKIARGTFSLKDLQAIAVATGCKFECNLVLTNGEKIALSD